MQLGRFTFLTQPNNTSNHAQTPALETKAPFASATIVNTGNSKPTYVDGRLSGLCYIRLGSARLRSSVQWESHNIKIPPTSTPKTCSLSLGILRLLWPRHNIDQKWKQSLHRCTEQVGRGSAHYFKSGYLIEFCRTSSTCSQHDVSRHQMPF